MEVYGNPATDREFGLISPTGLEWCVLFEFDKSGYVKDDEKNSIDAPKLLRGMQSNQKAANSYRVEQGLDELTITGWTKESTYNEKTKYESPGLPCEDCGGLMTVVAPAAN